MMSIKSIARSHAAQQVVGRLAAAYLRLVWKTTRVVYDPPDLYDRLNPELPAIIAVWHGQHLMVPFMRRREHRATVLISRHRDGEINAIVAHRLGSETIRGSGSHGTDFHRKGGVGAFRAMLNALADGCNVVMTPDVPKVARIAGLGVVKLAAASGRPIVPTVFVNARRITLDNWDKTTIALPFGRGVIAIGDIVRVDADADDAALEIARQRVEDNLNALTQRAYAIVDGEAASAGSAPLHRTRA
jgi:lysophospholipid acyltransferase (LPLAT)-like uncharacterized protein